MLTKPFGKAGRDEVLLTVVNVCVGIAGEPMCCETAVAGFFCTRPHNPVSARSQRDFARKNPREMKSARIGNDLTSCQKNPIGSRSTLTRYSSFRATCRSISRSEWNQKPETETPTGSALQTSSHFTILPDNRPAYHAGCLGFDGRGMSAVPSPFGRGLG